MFTEQQIPYRLIEADSEESEEDQFFQMRNNPEKTLDMEVVDIFFD